jgi:hypothetical protein
VRDWAERWIPLALLGGVLAVHFWSLLRYPAPYVDEAWILSRAWAWLHTGVPFGQLDVGVLDLVPGGWRVLGLSGTALQSLPLIGAEQVRLFGPRLESLLAGTALLAIVFAIGTALADARLGALAALLTSVSRAFFDSAHLARPDIYMAVFAYAALAVHLWNTRRRCSQAVLSGVLLGLAADVHPNAVVVLAAIALLFAIERGFGVLRAPDFWAFTASAALGIALPLAARILPDPGGYAATLGLVFGGDHAPPLTTLDLGVLMRSCTDSMKLFSRASAGGVPVLVGCGLWMLYRRDRLCARLAAIALSMLLAFMLLVRAKKVFYAIALGPALDLAIAGCLFQLWCELRARPWMRFAVQLLAVMLVGRMLLGGIPELGRDGYAEYRLSQKRINATITASDSVMGSQQYWLGLQQHAFYSWEGLAFHGHAHPGASLQAAFDTFKPDIFIIDQELGQFITDRPRSNLERDYLTLPAAQMTALLNKRGRLLASFPSPYGLTMVFRMRWD